MSALEVVKHDFTYSVSRLRDLKNNAPTEDASAVCCADEATAYPDQVSARGSPIEPVKGMKNGLDPLAASLRKLEHSPRP